jgi:hypothetical protein
MINRQTAPHLSFGCFFITTPSALTLCPHVGASQGVRRYVAYAKRGSDSGGSCAVQRPPG